MAAEQDELRKKNEELSRAYKEKSRKLLSTQELYDKLKRRLLLGHIQDAASEAVDATIHGGLAPVAYANDRMEPRGQYEQQISTPLAGLRYQDRLDQRTAIPANPYMGPPEIRSNTWAKPTHPQGLQISIER